MPCGGWHIGLRRDILGFLEKQNFQAFYDRLMRVEVQLMNTLFFRYF